MPSTTNSPKAAADPAGRDVRDLPQQQREATLVPSTYNPDENTVDVVWTTGARRRAYDWYSGTLYDEELVVSSDAVDMTRFDSGTVQVLDGHRVFGGVSAIMGIAQRGWIESGEGRATLKLSVRDEMAGIVADIKAGIIRSISFGYSVERYEVTDAKARSDGGSVPLWRATRWTPQEISFVTVPADPAASTRSQAVAPRGATDPHSQSSAARSGLPCEFVRAGVPTSTLEQRMPTPANTDPVATNTPSPDEAATRAAADAAKRAADISEVCTRHNVGHLAAEMIRSGVTLDQARGKVLEELARRDSASGGHINVRTETVRDEMQTRMAGLQEALMSRVDARAQLTDNGRQFRGMSLLETGREMLSWHGVNTRGMDKMQLATRIMTFRSGGSLGTSDFSSLMANVASKRLRVGYEENPGTYTRWARRAPNAPDFKSVTVAQLSSMPDLLKVNEHGEFKYGSLSDGAETYALLTYGRIVTLSRQAVINDDLRAFDRMIASFGASSARLENRLVYSQLTANAAMSDGTALFHASHGNLASGGPSALAFASLAAGRAAMRVQKGLQSEELNLAPSFLIVPASLEQTAYQFTSSQYVPAKAADVNEFRVGGRTALEPIVEPILDSNSATAWYMAALNSQVDTVEYCYLDGAEGPVVESEMGFEVDGISFKCREDFAAKAIDWRGLYKSAGA